MSMNEIETSLCVTPAKSPMVSDKDINLVKL